MSHRGVVEIIDQIGGDPACRALLGFPGAVEDLAHVADLAAQQCLLHLDRVRLQLVQALQRAMGVAGHAALLLGDDRIRPARDAGKAGDERRLELTHHRPADAQRIDHHPVAGEELDKIGAAERRRILVLLAAGQSEVDAFDFKGQMRHVIQPKRQAEQLAKRLNDRHAQRGGGAEARAGRRIDMGRDAQRQHSPLHMVAHHAQVNAGMQPQGGIGQGGPVRRHRLGHAEIICDEMHQTVLAHLDIAIGIAVDGAVQHGAAEFVAIGAEIGTTAGQAQTQRRAGPHHVIGRQIGRRGHDRTLVRCVVVRACAETRAGGNAH